MMPGPFHRDDLKDLAVAMLSRAGLGADRAEVVAELLVRTDEIGVTTHGISMVPYYVPELQNGDMATEGTWEVVRDGEVAMVWDGNYLPGHWVMTHAIDTCMERARRHGVACLSIRRSHHIGCLSVLTRIAAEQGFVCLIATSDPSGKRVAPFGGTEPLLTPNPFAVGYPGGDHPVLIDTCASVTTTSKVRELVNSGARFDHPWMLDAEGRATTDPNVAEAGGSILPTGGLDHGHKGFALALMVEMLTQGLSGHGRAEAPTKWGGNVYLQVMDPDAFAGAETFTRETVFLNDRCRENRPAPGVDRVRIPGDRAAAQLARTRERGISLPEEVWNRVATCAAALSVPLPDRMPT